MVLALNTLGTVVVAAALDVFLCSMLVTVALIIELLFAYVP